MDNFLKWVNNNSWTIVGLIIFILIISSYAVSSSYRDSQVKIVDCYDAQIIARKFVEQRLKAPSTAAFPMNDDSYECTPKEGNIWLVKSYVDAQNSLGAMLRQTWWVEMKYKKSTDKWELMNIAIY